MNVPSHPSFKDLWRRIQEPRFVTAIQAIEYVVVVIAGIIALISPPATVTAVMGGTLMHVTGIMLVTGGTIALIGTPGGIWWLERIGLLAILGGLSSYLSVVIHLELTAGGSRLLQIAVITIALLSLLKRLVRIWNLEFDPEKDAKRLANRG